MLDGQCDVIPGFTQNVDGLLVSDRGKEGVVDLDDGVADVQVIVVFVPAYFRDQDWQVVIRTAFQTDAQAAG